jgi:hypothetical protein
MNDMPVADYKEDQNEESDHEQSVGFGGIDRVPAIFMAGVILAKASHTSILALSSRNRIVIDGYFATHLAPCHHFLVDAKRPAW